MRNTELHHLKASIKSLLGVTDVKTIKKLYPGFELRSKRQWFALHQAMGSERPQEHLNEVPGDCKIPLMLRAQKDMEVALEQGGIYVFGTNLGTLRLEPEHGVLRLKHPKTGQVYGTGQMIELTLTHLYSVDYDAISREQAQAA